MAASEAVPPVRRERGDEETNIGIESRKTKCCFRKGA